MINTGNISTFLGGTDTDDPVVKMGDSGIPQDADLQTPAPAAPSEPAPAAPDNQEPVPNTPAPAAEPEPVNAPAPLVDEDVFGFLTDKLGRQVTSFEDLRQQEVKELDPQLKEIADWRERTGRPLNDWIAFSRDFSQMPDIDVVRENLKMDYPTLSDEQIELELSLNYLPSEDDMDNEKAIKNLKLTKDATKGRARLDEMKLDLDKAASTGYPVEVQQDLALAKQYKDQQVAYNESTVAYNTALQSASSKAEKIQLKLSDTLTLDYSVPAEERGKLPQFVNDMPHWKNADGTYNHDAIIADAIKIKNFDALIKIAYEQGVSSGTDAVAAAASNINFNQPTANAAVPKASGGYEVEGFDNFMRGNRITIGRR